MVNLPSSRISSVRHYTPGEGAQVRTKSTTWGFSTSIATRNQHPISPAQYMSDNFAAACWNQQRVMVGIYKLHAGTFEQIEQYLLFWLHPLDYFIFIQFFIFISFLSEKLLYTTHWIVSHRGSSVREIFISAHSTPLQAT